MEIFRFYGIKEKKITDVSFFLDSISLVSERKCRE